VDSLKVVFVETGGAEKVIEDAQPGQSLLTIARANAVGGILGDCGGCCSCATCHVYVDPQWQGAVGDAGELEASTLEMASDSLQDGSRLCCQIVLRPELSGLRVLVAPSV
jgi:2Fe-2S ferredoxin